GYKSGLQLEPAAAEVPSGGAVKGVVLKESTTALGSVTGDVNFVNAGTQQTSVVLVVESTFNEALARGEVPIGLRQFPVTGHYSFTGVPLGDYVVLAAFENDALVRDPDTSIGGTAIQHVHVDSKEVSVAAFKLTGALAVMQPGAEQAEVMEGTPTFVWEDDSSEDGYEVVVHDTFGNEVWRNAEVPRVTGSATVSLPYGGPALERGYYQFRATSFRNDTARGNTTRVYISATEDLKGVFVIR
ncbi:MAG TPA: hypothetical protein VFQ61_05120, partial [Polyangiaceae bacterium]|nr:hypothetical protein [Polyangiaceae bacterium]